MPPPAATVTARPFPVESADLESWRKATGQETRDRKSTVGKVAADSITLPDDYRLRDPRKLNGFAVFGHLRAGKR